MHKVWYGLCNVGLMLNFKCLGMKKTSLFIASLFASALSMAQDYTFSVSSNPYQELVGATSLTQGQVWDDPSLIIPIGFNFEYFNTVEDSVFIANGLGADLEFFSSNPNGFRIFGATDEDIIDRGYDLGISQSDISYKLVGTAPNRILKIQWKNVGFYGDYDDDGICQDFANFQVWLYESTMTIEFHYGQWSVSQPAICFYFAAGPTVFMTNEIDIMNQTITGLYELWNNPASPTINSDEAQFGTSSLSGIPAQGTVYRFAKNNVGIQEAALEGTLAVYPNPASTHFSLDLEAETVTLIDMSGKTWTPSKVNGKYALEGIPAGMYYVVAQNQDGIYREKLIVQ